MTQRNMAPTRIGMDFQREDAHSDVFAIHILIEVVVHEIQEQSPCQTSKDQGDQTIASTTRCKLFIKALIAAKTPKIKRKESKIMREGASFNFDALFHSVLSR